MRRFLVETSSVASPIYHLWTIAARQGWQGWQPSITILEMKMEVEKWQLVFELEERCCLLLFASKIEGGQGQHSTFGSEQTTHIINTSMLCKA